MTRFIFSLSAKFEVAKPPPHPPHNVKFGEMSVGLVNIFDPGSQNFRVPPPLAGGLHTFWYFEEICENYIGNMKQYEENMKK